MKPSRIRVSAFRMATCSPEATGAREGEDTTLVTVEVGFDTLVGFGFTYADVPTAHFVCEHLAGIALASDVMSPPATFSRMEVAVRNVGREGVAAAAIAAVDMALWDAKAKRLGCSLVELLGSLRESVETYASGGFPSQSLDALRAQLARYVDEGFARVKMRIGDDGRTEDRVRAARDALGARVHLFVDANGAFTPKHALEIAEDIVDYGVRWFEEPCSSDDLEGLRFVRERAPISMDIAAGEYGYESRTFERLLAAGAVDVLQADATRCGVTGFMRVAASCEARGVPLSAHCAPTIHAQLGCAAPEMTHVEYFHDHAQIEAALFDGAIVPRRGSLRPDRSRPGIGVALKRVDAEKYRVFDGDIAARVAR